jgi:hypothetical protein
MGVDVAVPHEKLFARAKAETFRDNAVRVVGLVTGEWK